jgi:hypothetical protein
LLKIECAATALGVDLAAAYHYQMTENKSISDSVEEARRHARAR